MAETPFGCRLSRVASAVAAQMCCENSREHGLLDEPGNAIEGLSARRSRSGTGQPGFGAQQVADGGGRNGAPYCRLRAHASLPELGRTTVTMEACMGVIGAKIRVLWRTRVPAL